MDLNSFQQPNSDCPSTGSSVSASTPRSSSSMISNSVNTNRSTLHKILRGVLVVPKGMCSISFIVLVLATCCALGPSLIVWTQAVSSGMAELQDRVLFESLKQRALSVKNQLEFKLSSCESQVVGYASWLNAFAKQNSGSEITMDFLINRTLEMAFLTIAHEGCAGSVVIFLEDGGYGVIISSDYGPIFGVQRGFPPNASLVIYSYDIPSYMPHWEYPIHVGFSALEKHAGVSSDLIERLTEDPLDLQWTQLNSHTNAHVMTADLLAGISDPSGNSLLGVLGNTLCPADLAALFADSAPQGIICSFIQDSNGCLIASTCEKATVWDSTLKVVSRVCTWNSTVDQVQKSQPFLSQALESLQSDSNSSVVMYQTEDDSFGYALVETPHGFTAVVTIVAGM